MFSEHEYRAVRTGAGLIERSARGRIALSGADRASYLHGVLTNDIEGLAPGRGCYAAYLTPQGRMIADVQVLNLGDVILAIVHPDVTRQVLERFDRFIITEDVRLEDWTGSRAQYGLHGPRAAAVLAPALRAAAAGRAGADGAEQSPAEAMLSSYAEYENSRWDFHGAPLLVSRHDELGLPGFDLLVERAHAPALRDALVAAGAVPFGDGTARVLRVEAGRPEFHADMDEDTIPLEAGIGDRAISFTKGCYVGQEIIIRVMHRGQGRVAKKLAGMTFGAPAGGADERETAVPDAGAPVLAGDREIGRVTTAVFSPAAGRAIALGYVHRDFAEPGTAIRVVHRAGSLEGAVTAVVGE